MRIGTLVASLLSVFILAGVVSARGPEVKLPQMAGYQAVPVRGGPMNRLLTTAAVNGHKATFLIDTGAPISVLGSEHAKSFGVQLASEKSEFGGDTPVNGRSSRIGLVQSLTAGAMDFGSGPMALLAEFYLDRSSYRNDQIAGIIGADILTRYKATVNCRTHTIFFKVGKGPKMQITRIAAEQHFTRIPLREETTRHFTVPATIAGRSVRLIVDTGAPFTIFDEEMVKSVGVKLRKTLAQGGFINSQARAVSLGEFTDLSVGGFHLAPQKLGVSAIGDFLQRGGESGISGLVGIDTLVFNRAIIDFDSMNLFLK